MTRTLSKPPIVEVVCGFIFPPIDLTPIFVGKYWAAQKEATFPKADIRPAVTDGPSVVMGGLGPVRSWLLSDDETRVLQIQPDRLYVNWRKQGDGSYPHFEDRGGTVGVLSSSLAELAELSDYSEKTLGVRPQPRTLELTKVDFLQRGTHWEDTADLASLIQALVPVSSLVASPEIVVAVSGQRGNFRLAITLRTMVNPTDLSSALHIETRVTGASGIDLAVTLRAMNVVANEAFFGLLTEKAYERFGATP